MFQVKFCHIHGTPLGTDLFYWKYFDFLVLGDYFSKFLIVRKLPSSTSSAVSKEISNIFTEFCKGIHY